jgi:S-formylglutathione hydrolase FrmB
MPHHPRTLYGTTAGLLLGVLLSLRAAAHPVIPRLTAGHVERLDVPAPGQHRTRPVYIYRPTHAPASIPVVYLLHGVPGFSVDFVEQGVIGLIDQSIAHGARPFMVVVPDGNGTSHEDTEFVNAIDGTDQIETFIADTVRHAIHDDRSPQQRAIAGFSMGGYGCMNLATRHRDLYGQVVSIAGYYRIDDVSGMLGGDATLDEANSPFDHLEAARGLRIFLADGIDDQEPVVRGQPQKFHAALTAAHIQSTLIMAPGTHSWDFVRSQVPAMVRFLEAGWGR